MTGAHRHRPGRLPALAVAAWLPVMAAEPLRLIIHATPENDLYRVLSASGVACERYGSAAEAIAKAPRGAAVLLLADGYPDQTTQVAPALFRQAASKQLRLYVEFPSSLPGLTVGEPRTVGWERAVVASGAFGPGLARLRILGIHDCRFVPVDVRNADIVLARVAGFDTAVYGLPAEGVYPILFEHPRGEILVATTKLSQFQTARYAPTDAWEPIWRRILTWLAPRSAIPALEWTPSVRPAFRRDEPLPDQVELAAFRRGVAAFSKARLFVHPSWKAVVETAGRVNDSVGEPPKPDWPLGDGSEGILEGFSSRIRHDGTQPVRWNLRADCIGETSFAMALSSAIDSLPEAARVAANLNDYIYFHSVLARGPRADPDSPSFGLIGWSYPTSPGVYYGDDNARSMLGTIGAAALLRSRRWDEPLLRCLLGNLRTTGKQGFRGNRLEEASLQKNGWRYYFDSDRINYRPHYEGYLWACFLWAYHKTGYPLFRHRAETAIRMTVGAYPHEWRWTNGIQQERARMLLPLAWLVRVEDTQEHREWLRRLALDLLANQDASGAIREELGPEGKGSYGPPKSNEAYGTSEAPLIQQNGDPLADLLYTTNFAFLGLHEAAAATSEPLYRDAADKLARFLCRIQVRSEARPELDGWWFRAFEYRRWEYWASNADVGWGAWSTETGWTQSWIAAVLGMRHLRTSLWDLTASSQIGSYLDRLLPVMLRTEESR